MKSKLYIGIVCVIMIMLVGTVSAMNWDNIKEFKKDTNYGTIRIYNSWIIPKLIKGNLLAEHTLLENTFSCGNNCYGKIKSNFYVPTRLYDKVEFYNIDTGKKIDIDSYKIYIIKEENVSVPIYNGVCGKYVNDTDYCDAVKIDEEIKVSKKEVEYDGRFVSGKVEWIIRGKKQKSQNVDWIITGSNGKKWSEWADWSASLILLYNDTMQSSTGWNPGTHPFTYNNGLKLNSGGTSESKHFDDSNINRTEYWFKTYHSGTGSYIHNFYFGSNDKSLFIGLDTNNFNLHGCGATKNFNIAGKHNNNWAYVIIRIENRNVSAWLDFSSFSNIDISTPPNLSSQGACFPDYQNDSVEFYRHTSYEVGFFRDLLIYEYNNPPIVTLNASPIEAENFSVNNISFNCSASDDSQIDNITLWVDSNKNYTKTIGASAGSIEQTVNNINDGRHNWTCSARDDSNSRSWATNKSFLVDITSPNLTIVIPSGITEIINYTTSHTFTLNLNWSIIDGGGVQYCNYYNGTGNTTVTCGQNVSWVDNFGSKTLIVYANDTIGNEGIDNKSINFIFNIWEQSQSYNNNTVEGSSETFEINITTNTSFPTQANLWYNGTSYSSSSITNIAGNNYTIKKTITIPTSQATDTNMSFFWQIILANSYIGNSTTANQTVNNIRLDDCGTNNNLIFNLTHKDEETQNVLVLSPTNNNTIEVEINISSASGTIPIANYSKQYTNNTNVSICITDNSLNNTSLRLDALFRYDADTYASEFYHIQNFRLTNNSIPQHIDLLDLKTADSQEFLITFKDANFVPIKDALIDITRKYIQEGTFKTVEIGKTDDDGSTIGHFVLSDVIYTIIVSKEGVILGTFPNVIAVCDNVATGDCTIELNAFSTGTQPEEWKTDGGISYVYDCDVDTRTITVTFSGETTKTVLVNTTKMDRFGNQTVCSDELTTASGTLTCVIPQGFGNITALSYLYSDGELIAIRDCRIIPSPLDNFGYFGIMLLIILMMTIPMMFISSSIGIIIGAVLGFITASLLTVFSGGSFLGYAFGWLVVMAVILIIKISGRAK